MKDHPIKVAGIKFVQAADQENIVRAMPEDIYKTFLHVSKDRHIPVLEFSAKNLAEAKAKYMEAILEGVIRVVDEPLLTPPGSPTRSQG
jgi:hypothetical protein